MNLKDIKRRLKGDYKDKYHELQQNYKETVETVEEVKEDYSNSRKSMNSSRSDSDLDLTDIVPCSWIPSD